MSGHTLWRDVKEKFLRERALIGLKGLVDAYRACPKEDEAEAIVNILHEVVRLVDAFYPPDEEGDELLENSSFGSPQAKAVIAAGRRELSEQQTAAWYDTHNAVTGEELPRDQWAHGSVPPDEASEVFKDCGS